MINFNYESDFQIDKEIFYQNWIERCCVSEGYSIGELNYIFCNDDYLLEINKKYLDHDALTDIITFDYVSGKTISGDIYISEERVRENAAVFEVAFENELLRVMVHGVLHLMGYKDKSEEDSLIMREKEEEKIKLFHVER
ncbi:rRNA maturation RNase YbeY [Maribacter sp. 2210JD10-5]|uniref:rRNA maturation RNase YbeY n=1 Tax=Maribacter sp. 2210JD10-5 TaxID=3386272 RepID=UPI0039BD1614